MTTAVARRRGTTADNNRFTGIEGEITVDLGNAELRVHTGDGTVGGYGTARKDLENVDQSAIANKGIAKNDLSNVDNIIVLNKASAAAATNAGGGIAYKNLTNTVLSSFGNYQGDDDTVSQAGGLAYKDLSNIENVNYNALGIAKTNMSNVTDEVILNKAVARAASAAIGGEGLAYKNFKNTKISQLGTFNGTDDSGTSAGGLAYKDLSNVTSVNRLVTLGLAKADLTNVTASSILSKAVSAASTAGGGGLAYQNLSNTSLTAYGTDFHGIDDTPTHAGGLAYKDLSNTKLSDYGTFIGTDDSSTSAAGLAYKDLSNVTGTAFFNTLGIAKIDLSNVTDQIVFNKVVARATSLGGNGIAYKNLSNLTLSDFSNFLGTDDSATNAGGLAYKDLSNTKLSDFSNFLGNDDVNKTGLAYRDLSNTNINSFLSNYALKNGTDISISELGNRGLALSDLSNVDRSTINKVHINFLLNSTCSSVYSQYVSGDQVQYDNEAYDKWFAIDEGNSSITNYSMTADPVNQQFTIYGSFVQVLSNAKKWFQSNKVYVWCSGFSSNSDDFSCNFIDYKNYSRKYWSTNKQFTYDSTRGIYYIEFDFSEVEPSTLMPTSNENVGFFISSKNGTTLTKLQIELNEITAYERKSPEQEQSECLPTSNKMRTLVSLVEVTDVEPTRIYNDGELYYNTVTKLIYIYDGINNQWLVYGNPQYETLYIDINTGGTYVKIDNNGLITTQAGAIIRDWSE